MIASVEGRVGAVAFDSLVIEVGGIGYRVFASPAILSTAAPGSTLKLPTYHLGREDQQALYGFRSADVRVFLNTAKEFEQAGGDIGHLSQNFRSEPSLLGQLNALSAPLFEDSEVPFSPMVAGRPTNEGAERVGILRVESTEQEPRQGHGATSL